MGDGNIKKRNIVLDMLMLTVSASKKERPQSINKEIPAHKSIIKTS
jgi:hypothetical protein